MYVTIKTIKEFEGVKQMFTENQMEQIKSSVNGSAIWADINQRVKALYEKANRVPSDEEYQAVRTMIFCKAVSEDKELFKTLSDNVWQTLQGVN